MSKLRNKNLKAILYTLMLLLVFIFPAAAATTISIASQTVSPGGTVTVPIMANGITNVAAYTISLTYNQTVVVVDSVGAGALGAVINNINNAAGVTLMSAFSTTPQSGNVTLANVVLRAVGTDGQTSPLTLAVATLIDNNGNTIPATVSSGTFSITAAPVNGTITGTVTDDTGKPIAGATVDVASGTTIVASATTSASGTYSISIAAGTYKVTFTLGSQSGFAYPVTVTSGGITTANMVIVGGVPPALVSAVTPNSRNAQIGVPVTVFISVINGGGTTATGVTITQASSLPVNISYQQWNGTTLIGAPNTPVDIAAGGTVNYVLTINATSAFSTSSLTFNVSSTNGATAPISAVNTLTMSANATAPADVIMISTNMNVSTAVNTATSFAVATTNVGANATGVSFSVQVPSSIKGLAIQVNQTNAITGAIIGPATGLTINSGAQPTFAVFLQPTQPIAFDPTNNRITLQLVDGTGKVIGAQSVAISTK